LTNVGNWSGNFDKHNTTRSDRDFNDKSLRAQYADPQPNTHFTFRDGTPEHFTNDTVGSSANWKPTTTGENYRTTMADKYRYEASMLAKDNSPMKGVTFSEDSLVDYTLGDGA
jgi:hypothetical protein